MYWLNIDQLKTSVDSPSSLELQETSKPQQRWGQSCVSANNRIYIISGYEGKLRPSQLDTGVNSTSHSIGSYLGDVWFFDFQTLQFGQLHIQGEDKSLLSRSNHTAVFYKPHNS